MKYWEEIALERQEAKQEGIKEERANTEKERQRADIAENRAEKYKELLKMHGIEPDEGISNV